MSEIWARGSNFSRDEVHAQTQSVVTVGDTLWPFQHKVLLGEDFIGGAGPDERLRACVVLAEIVAESVFQLAREHPDRGRRSGWQRREGKTLVRFHGLGRTRLIDVSCLFRAHCWRRKEEDL